MGTRITQDGRENKDFFRFSVLLPMGEKEKTWYSLEVGACFVPFFDWHFSAHMVNSKNKETKLGGIFPWSIFRPSRPAICARAPRTAAAASARPPASLPARPAAASPTRSARTRISKLFLKKCRLFGRHFSCGVSLYKENGKLGYIELTIDNWKVTIVVSLRDEFDSVLQKYRVFDVFHVYENVFSSSLQGIPSLSIVNWNKCPFLFQISSNVRRLLWSIPTN